MTDLATDLRNIATEARPVLRRNKDGAKILAGLGKVCRAKGIDWAQLKALLNAEIDDEDDESGSAEHVTKILDKADAASAYADLLFRKMNKENFSSGNPGELRTAPEKPVDAIVPAALTVNINTPKSLMDVRHAVRDDLAIPDDLSIPKAFRRVPQEAAS